MPFFHGSDRFQIPESFIPFVKEEFPATCFNDNFFENLPYAEQIHGIVERSSEFVIKLLAEHFSDPPPLLCTPVFGDGTRTFMKKFETENEKLGLIVISVDLRLVYETTTFLLCSPVSRHTPLLPVVNGYQKLMLAARLIAQRNTDLRYIAAGLIAEAQENLYSNESGQLNTYAFQRLVDESFLTEEMLLDLMCAQIAFCILHEFAHYAISESPELKKELEDSLLDLISAHGTDEQHKRSHDREQESALRSILPDPEALSLLDFDSAASETHRLQSSSFSSRYDREELLCDSFATQNCASLLFGELKVGSSHWPSLRSAITYLLNNSWIGPARTKLLLKLSTIWNELALETNSIKRNATTHNIQEMLWALDRISQFQNTRAKFALDGFDLASTLALHDRSKSSVSISEFAHAFFPNKAYSEHLVAFEIEMYASLSEEIFSLQSFSRYSSRGRALFLVSPLNAIGADPGNGSDAFSYYAFNRTDQFPNIT